MLTIVRDAVDDRAYSFAREARILRKDGAYHETFEFHDHVILQVRAVLHRRVFVNSRVTPVWSTAEAVFGVVFVEGVHSLIFCSALPVCQASGDDESSCRKIPPPKPRLFRSASSRDTSPSPKALFLRKPL